MKIQDDVLIYRFSLCMAIVFLIGNAASAMSQFTADSEVVSAIVSKKSGIWKVLAGRILSIKQAPATDSQKKSGSVMAYASTFDIQTEEPPENPGNHSRICTLTVSVVIKRDFMVIEGTPDIKYGAPSCR